MRWPDILTWVHLVPPWRWSSYTVIALSGSQLLLRKDSHLIRPASKLTIIHWWGQRSLKGEGRRGEAMWSKQVLNLLQNYIEVPSVRLNMWALYRHITQRLAHSCEAFLETEEAAAAAPFVFWSETSKWPSPSISAVCSLAKAAACLESW